MKIRHLFHFLLGVAVLPVALPAANRVFTLTAPVTVTPGQNFTVPCSASTDQGVNGEQLGFFYLSYSLDGGATWTVVCADQNVGTSASRNATITAGAAGTTVVVKAEIAYRGGTAHDVDFTGAAMNWTAWDNWETPPGKYAYIPVVAPTAGQTSIPPITYSSGQNVVVTDPSTITTANNSVTVASGATVVFRAGASIFLLPGFTAASGSSFTAVIDLNLAGFSDLTDSDKDGLPDAWEMLYFGNLTTANGATNFDGDGLSDAAEYRAGTNPIVNENTAALPGGVQVVVRIPSGQYQGVKTDWSIVSVP